MNRKVYFLLDFIFRTYHPPLFAFLEENASQENLLIKSI